MLSWSPQSTYTVVAGAGVPCALILRFAIWSLVPLSCRNPACPSEIFVLVFTLILSSIIRRSILLACETSSCSVICTLFNLRSPFLGSGMNVNNVHPSGHSPVSQIATHSMHYVQYCLSCLGQFCRDLIKTCAFATCCLTYGTNNLWTKWWWLLFSMFLFISFPFFIMVQVVTTYFPPVCDLCSFSQIFASRWLDTLCPVVVGGKLNVHSEDPSDAMHLALSELFHVMESKQPLTQPIHQAGGNGDLVIYTIYKFTYTVYIHCP